MCNSPKGLLTLVGNRCFSIFGPLPLVLYPWDSSYCAGSQFLPLGRALLPRRLPVPKRSFRRWCRWDVFGGFLWRCRLYHFSAPPTPFAPRLCLPCCLKHSTFWRLLQGSRRSFRKSIEFWWFPDHSSSKIWHGLTFPACRFWSGWFRGRLSLICTSPLSVWSCIREWRPASSILFCPCACCPMICPWRRQGSPRLSWNWTGRCIGPGEWKCLRSCKARSKTCWLCGLQSTSLFIRLDFPDGRSCTACFHLRRGGRRSPSFPYALERP